MARPSKPTNLKLLEGNRGKRATSKQEPDPEYLEDLAAPGWLTPAARLVWDELAPVLRKQRLLTVVDIDALAAGCAELAMYRALHQRLEVDNLVIASTPAALNGAPAKGEHINPWLIVQGMSLKKAMGILRDFGMTPAARTRIALQPQGDLFGGEEAGNGTTGGRRYFS